jgi:hypothetical protein
VTEPPPSGSEQRRACLRPGARAGTLALAAVLLCQLSACGAGSSSGASTADATSAGSERAALIAYLQQVEPLRLAVNRLLETADPILSAYRDGRASPRQAAQRMGALERRFAAYTVDIAAIQPAGAQLRALNAPYAHTYILEDSYLSALTTGLAERKLDSLPNTQADQRAAIIQWRTGLTVLARRYSVKLPGDLQAAGRGEIAPSPGGS